MELIAFQKFYSGSSFALAFPIHSPDKVTFNSCTKDNSDLPLSEYVFSTGEGFKSGQTWHTSCPLSRPASLTQIPCSGPKEGDTQCTILIYRPFTI